MAKKKNHIPWIIGSLALFTAGVLIIPPMITKISTVAYKASNKNIDDDELFPEPVIEKKSDEEEGAENDGGV